MALTIAVALLASVCFAVASVLQHHGARDEHHGARDARRRSPLHVGLLVELAGKPAWLAGVLAQVAGVALHLLAVNLGPLSVVQPVLTVGLVIALGLQRLAARPVSQPAMLSAGLVVLGLAVFLAVDGGVRRAARDR
jgi:hypothetical protein